MPDTVNIFDKDMAGAAPKPPTNAMSDVTVEEALTYVTGLVEDHGYIIDTPDRRNNLACRASCHPKNRKGHVRVWRSGSLQVENILLSALPVELPGVAEPY